MSKLFGDNSSNLYPASRVLINDIANVQEYEITAECENNPVLLLSILYGGTSAAEYADVFFAANHITDPYTQLTKGRLVKRIDIEAMSAIQTNAKASSSAVRTTKVRHAKVSNNKVTF